MHYPKVLLFFLALSSYFLQIEADCSWTNISCGLANTDEANCTSVGCCWKKDNLKQPQGCYLPTNAIQGQSYSFQSVLDQPGKKTWNLTLTSPSGLKFSPEFTSLAFEVVQQTQARTYVKIYPPGQDQWEIPNTVLPRPADFYPEQDTLTSFRLDDQNNFLVERKDTGELLFRISSIVFQTQYLQFVLLNTSDRFSYGFGESSDALQQFIPGTRLSLWATDLSSFTFQESLYSSHPFLIQVQKNSGQTSGLFFMNSNAIQLTNNPESITIQSTGGIIELYILAGPTPTNVIQQYLEIIGKPAMVPYWSLGFHNCRWGYPNLKYVQEIVNNYSIAQIPLETQWLDIDYMDNFLDFTFDPKNFPKEEVQRFISDLHQNNQHFVPIIDPGIKIDPNYSVYTNGIEMNVFIKDLNGVDPISAHVWPGETNFPDWFAENASKYWGNELQNFHNDYEFDGIWLDMNEIANFCNVDGKGQIFYPNPDLPCTFNGSYLCCLLQNTTDPSNVYDFGKFVPNVARGSLGARTIPMSSVHSGGLLEYNVHNLFGLMESRVTNDALKKIRGKRPFVLSRSTFPSSGVSTAHWTGDNAATWEDLRASIVQMNNFAFYGIPMVGADICGFVGSPSEELCTRWVQVGAFSPFSRAHSALATPNKELFRWPIVAETSRKFLQIRYQLLPFLYTLIFESHSLGKPVHNSLWTQFPEDQNTLDLNYQYMWSDSILFIPVVTPGAVSVSGYFPRGIWYSMNEDVVDASQEGKFVDLDTPLDETNIYVRAGKIIPMQSFAMTTQEARTTPWKLLVVLDQNGTAAGHVFIDDGEQIDLVSQAYIEFTVAAESLQSKVIENTYVSTQSLRTITIIDPSLKLQDSSCAAVINRVRVDTQIEFISSSSGNFTKLTFQIPLTTIVPITSDFNLRWACGPPQTQWWYLLIPGGISVLVLIIVGLYVFCHQDDYEVIQ